MAFPTTDCVRGLVVLAWYYFQDNSSSVLGVSERISLFRPPRFNVLAISDYRSSSPEVYLSIAIRMAEDIGLNRNNPKAYADDAHAVRSKLLFWALYFSDRIAGLGSGRKVWVRESAGLVSNGSN